MFPITQPVPFPAPTPTIKAPIPEIIVCSGGFGRSLKLFVIFDERNEPISKPTINIISQKLILRGCGCGCD